MGVSSITDSKEREKVADFVTYYTSGTTWAALKGNPKRVNPGDACGKTVGVRQGTVQVNDITARSVACAEAGKPAVQPVVRTQQTEINADLVSGRTDAMLADTSVVGYAMKQTAGELQAIGATYDTAPYGYAIGKNTGRFKDAVLAAVKEIMADGTYRRILDRWGVRHGAIANPVINGAG